MPQAETAFSIRSGIGAPDIFRALIGAPEDRLERLSSKAMLAKNFLGTVIDHPTVKGDDELACLLLTLHDQLDGMEAIAEGLHALEMAA
ncbi:hypothetical protein DXH95_03125 [Sphingorhabdus pulchriflava]|uniref:Uncharacterized protein n=1 Tax=Sphingorhabdus pulchriflava TaxID=2292257 RepID=A0A371BGA2_9SPHN|nr:hypothetical protein [Sphingorhabdus pulchriflava]RDV06433.1 hypothetical protein DXH95_03125 [Sphingorhabdus pulchriflava]